MHPFEVIEVLTIQKCKFGLPAYGEKIAMWLNNSREIFFNISLYTK